LWPGPNRPAARSEPAVGAVGGGATCAGEGDSRSVHRGCAFPGNRGQNLEPPRGGRRPPAGAQWQRDGRVPAAVSGQLSQIPNVLNARVSGEGTSLVYAVDDIIPFMTYLSKAWLG